MGRITIERQKKIEGQYKLFIKNGYNPVDKCQEDISQINFRLSQAKEEDFDSQEDYKDWKNYAKQRKYFLVNVFAYAKRKRKYNYPHS